MARPLGFLALPLLLAAAPSAPSTSPPAPGASIQQLQWMAGCWAADPGEPGSGEMWMAPAGGTMLGVSRTVKGAKTPMWEFMQIREEGGTLVFIALPSGQTGASFPLKSMSGTEVLFEQPAHDFPQRIKYALGEGGALRARIEGPLNGQERGIDFAFKKAPCP